MHNLRFGRKLALPSTRSIKHQLLMMRLEDEVKAILPGGSFNQEASLALAGLRRLGNAHPTLDHQ